jgi:hypothetical protein
MNRDLENVTLGLVVELSLLREVLTTLRVDGKHWWVVGDPTDAAARGVIKIAHGYENCYDRLNTLRFPGTSFWKCL